MIYDRKRADVDTANEIRTNKLQKGIPLTADDVAKLERGMLTEVTFNRIEGKQAELKERLNELGYWNTPTVNRQWVDGEVFDYSDYLRVVDILEILKSAYFVYPDTPEVVILDYYSFNNINALEKSLHDIEEILDDMISKYKVCGVAHCGED